jgi:2-C-methyl-D-erythritol 4-phosphate cytidylyltransferase/2-C-methyl-D-erythritol 2,4-cyclodiphosphate synthase
MWSFMPSRTPFSGALADGDIGVHFPPSDERWRGVSSDRFVAFAVERLRAASGTLDHIDVTLVRSAANRPPGPQ